MSSPKFVLGFIAGEGSFTTGCVKADDMRYGINPCIVFKLNVKEKNILEKLRKEVGAGTINKQSGKNGQWCWTVRSQDGCRKVADYVESNAGGFFKSTKKWESFKLWSSLLEDRDELVTSQEGMKEFVLRSRKINDKSARNKATDAGELIEIIENSETYTCGATGAYTNCCGNTVDSPEDTCYRH